MMGELSGRGRGFLGRGLVGRGIEAARRLKQLLRLPLSCPGGRRPVGAPGKPLALVRQLRALKCGSLAAPIWFVVIACAWTVG